MTNYIVKRKRVFTGKVVRVDELDMDFGSGKKPTFELISFHTVTGVSALPVEGEFIYLIKHYQIGRKGIGYSLPTGGLYPGEDPRERMNQELSEELGMRAGKLTLMLRPEMIPSYIGDEPGYIYLAENLTPHKTQGDEDFEIVVEKLPLKEALNKIKQGIIADGRTIMAVLTYKEWYG